MTDLQITHLRFNCVATTPIRLGGHAAGNSIRNAIANVMLNATCPLQPRPQIPPPEHIATCPACWLLAAELDPGTVVRAYTIIPPIPPLYDLEPGERFAFGLTLFGVGFEYLPYIVLAVNEAGYSEGLGPGRREGGGRFRLESIFAVDPLRRAGEVVMAPGDNVVHVPSCRLDTAAIDTVSKCRLQRLPASGELILHFRTPLRLVEKQQPMRMPDFAVLFKRHLYRLDELNRQFAGAGRRSSSGVDRLNRLAEQVRMVDAEVRWHEQMVTSGRRNQRTPLSGLVGAAVYRSEHWPQLLPYLLWAEAIQVGKSTAKGNGVLEMESGDGQDYWDWLRQPPLVAGFANPPGFSAK